MCYNVFGFLLCRSLLGGGFDKANDVMSTSFPGSDGAGWFKFHLITHITPYARCWFFIWICSSWQPLLMSRLPDVWPLFTLADFEPQRGMDRYLDSLFDPVLSEGSEVRYIIHSLGQTWPPERGFLASSLLLVPVHSCVKLFFFFFFFLKNHQGGEKSFIVGDNRILCGLLILRMKFRFSELYLLPYAVELSDQRK